MVVSIGADYSHARPNQAFFTRHGLTFACRYLLDDARDGGKALKKPEALQLSSWGISICSNFEYAIGGMLRGSPQGVADARTALAELRAIGAPRDVVYFSCDTDVSIAQIPAVLDYMRGAASVLGKANVGVYGEYDLIEAAHAAGYRWLWQCYAWSRGLWSAHATVRQVHNGAFPGEYDADLNHAMTADIGQWTLGDDMPLTQADANLVVNTLMQTALGRSDAYDDGLDHKFYEAVIGSVNAAKRAERLHARVGAIADQLGVVAADVDQAEELGAQGITATHEVGALVSAIQAGDTNAIADAVVAKLGPVQAQALLDAMSTRLAS